jgi:hypothetical protein
MPAGKDVCNALPKSNAGMLAGCNAQKLGQDSGMPSIRICRYNECTDSPQGAGDYCYRHLEMNDGVQSQQGVL